VRRGIATAGALPGLLLGVALGVGGCAGQAGPDAAFEHDAAGPATAWNHAAFDAAADKFTFAVFSDLTGGERDRVFEVAIAQINLLRPELILSVGDLIEGDSAAAPGLHAEWDSFDQRAGEARAPVFRTGGNHDLTGEMLREVWRERYGSTWYHFVYKDVLFLVLDTEDNTPERMAYLKRIRDEAIELAASEDWEAYDESEYVKAHERIFGNITATQADYFIDVLGANPDVRWTFLFMHKPVWRGPGGTEFARIEAALGERPYTVFRGHFHAYDYEERNGRDYIGLGTTGGAWNPAAGRSMDQVALVTVDADGVDIANLLLPGILDKTGHVPLDGDDLCFEYDDCKDATE
jgi:hypothetical protein